MSNQIQIFRCGHYLEPPTNVGRPVEDGTAKLQVGSLGGYLDPKVERREPEPEPNYAGQIGAHQEHLPLPVMTFGNEKKKERTDDGHLPLPTMNFAGEKKVDRTDGKHLPLPSTA